MTSPTRTFFEELARRGHVPWLEHERGRVRFEVVDGDCIRQWTLTLTGGDLEVSQSLEDTDSDVDVVLRADRALFDRAVHGEANLLQAALCGEVSFSGSIELLGPVSRLLPGPPGQLGPRYVGGAGRRPA
jgi:predicted ATPase